MEYFISGIKKYVDFSGRARRKEYWMFILFLMIFYIVAGVLDTVAGTYIFSPLVGIGLFLPSISIATRRLHDTGRSGWWQLLSLIPLIGGIVLIVFLAQDSREGNSFGANPKTA